RPGPGGPGYAAALQPSQLRARQPGNPDRDPGLGADHRPPQGLRRDRPAAAVLRLLGRSTGMALDVTAAVRIEAPADDVAAVEFDPARDPEWIGGVDRIEWISPPPLAVGSQVRRIGGFMGRPIEW